MVQLNSVILQCAITKENFLSEYSMLLEDLAIFDPETGQSCSVEASRTGVYMDHLKGSQFTAHIANYSSIEYCYCQCVCMCDKLLHYDSMSIQQSHVQVVVTHDYS